MRFSRSEPGFLLSAAVHLGLLAVLLVHFSREQKFDDAQEAIPVETISENKFSEIMKGDKAAKETTKPRADKVADLTETKPTPPTPEAKRDAPAPPPPMKRLPDPGEADQTPPTPPTPPQRPAPPPPPAPAPPTPKTPPPPPDPKEEPEPDDAEPVKPPPRPKPPEKPVEKPAPQPPKPVEKPVPQPPTKAVEKPVEKPAPKPKLDEVAKLLAESKDKPAPKPKSGDDSAQPHRSPDLSEVAKLLNNQAPEAKFSTGREVSHTASLGAARGTGAKMSPSLSDSLNGILQEQYKQCWNYLPLTGGQKYIARIRVSYRPDGSLAAQPVLLNPPSDPALRGLAESALRAARRCNPLRIPAQFQPYYEQWKDWVVGFDPEILN
ncbi:cell envelope biogenesis protein TolA [Rhodoblastus sp. 17X3]|uniref:cell envelope biogenesis protein TolA n=1 Tax=Rhodoblastus sp. 17X3 TaxID=3047026 RepID=UPI0024B7D321|nr:cell envelope biogenesis protein TolA [Rhodoblastus sp. 17X3]MDI9848020.1 cell envelope biogenesis protein TolA [Rhodoblastus sp. 17X3]